ncbi:MAG TPA: hypothetical protein VF723_09545 [Pyrinomonadaceae bacterium]
MAMCAALVASGALGVRAQQAQQPSGQGGAGEQRTPLAEQPVALDAAGQAALAGRLLTTALGGTPDAPVRNVRFVVENRSAVFYTYVTGSVTFYNEAGVRCGEGLFTLNSLAAGESAETDAPGLRLTCSPASWRLVANNLLTRSSDVSRPVEQTAGAQTTAPAAAPVMQMLEIEVDGRVYSAPLGSTLEIPVRRRQVKITVRAAP